MVVVAADMAEEAMIMGMAVEEAGEAGEETVGECHGFSCLGDD